VIGLNAVRFKEQVSAVSRTKLGFSMTTREDDDPKNRKKPQLKTATQSPPNSKIFNLIGRRLKDYYEDVANQPVPDRFIDLLKQLDKKRPPGTED